jgi:3-isopropylmalate/(R)-2-methylmalate dehydratase large subunit
MINTAAIAKTFAKFGVERVKNPERFVIVLDHTVPASTEEYAQGHKEIRAFVEKQGIKAFYDAGVGICHQVLPEMGFALPGSLILGSDSHTTAYGALGAFSAVPAAATRALKRWRVVERQEFDDDLMTILAPPDR